MNQLIRWWLLAFTLATCNFYSYAVVSPLQAPMRQIEQQDLFKHFKELASDRYQGRKFTTKGNIMAQDYLVAQLQHYGIAPYQQGYRQPFLHHQLFSSLTGTNIVAQVTGSVYPDKFLVLSSHYDHLGHQGHKIFNGADDNASGSAALLAIANMLQQQPLKLSVILLFTDGEEVNLLGSKYFIEQNPDLIAKSILNINLDMLAGGRRTHCLHYLDEGLDAVLSDEAITQLAKLNEQQGMCVKHGFTRYEGQAVGTRHAINWKMASDHGMFARAGVPFIYYGVGTDQNYHTEHDDVAHSNLPFLLASTRLIYRHLRFIDQTGLFDH